MKNKKGFTLIELLAVIVVLAIIALIATPIVMNTIKNAKKGAAERTADNYIKQVETAVAEAKLEKNSVPNGTYIIDEEGNLLVPSLPNGKLEIEMSGNKPISGTLKIKNGGVSKEEITMTVGDYDVKYNQEKNKYETTKKRSTSVIYKNGEAVYFNVDNGTKCTSSEAVSTTGTKSGCMKFYTFNDDGGSTINLILDHNTTATVAWNSSGSVVNGPNEVLTQLKSDTDEWKGTITPSNYSNSKYTIDYRDYKARLITVNEIAKITENTPWDEKTSSDFYYFANNKNTVSDTCKSGNTSGCQYIWLYDRTNINCTEYGCLNNADSAMNGNGYWTISFRATFSSFPWSVNYRGALAYQLANSSTLFGVRPVITVLKSKLS